MTNPPNNLVRDIVGSGLYFTVYENVKVAISNILKSDKPHPLSIAIGGALAGTICWIAIYPLDTYKGIVQRDLYASTFDKSGQVVEKKKPIKFSSMFHRRMYRGLGLSIARTSIIGMTFFSCYEQLVKWI